MEHSTPHVPREYRALYTYLEHRYASVVVLTFEQIEALLGFALPTPARTEREWWTDVVDTQRHCGAWTHAGRTAAPNLAAGNITFERLICGIHRGGHGHGAAQTTDALRRSFPINKD